MAPRPAVRRERDNDFSAVGKIGRRTGITVPQGRLDENGLEEMSGLFSSPRKPSPLRQQVNSLNGIGGNSTSEVSEAMMGMDSTGLTPTQALSTRESLRRTPIPPPRSSSPKKTGINGSARRSNGVDVLRLAKQMPVIDPEDRENTPVFTPTRPAQSHVRRFSPSPEKNPLREVTTNGQAPSVSAKGKQRVPDPVPESRSYHLLTNVSDDIGYQHTVNEVEKEQSAIWNDDYDGLVAHGDDEDEPMNGNQVYAAEAGFPDDDDHQMHESIEVDEEYITPKAKIQGNREGRKRKSNSLEEDERDISQEHLPPAQPAKKAKTTTNRQSKAKASKGVDYGFPLDPALAPESQPQPKGSMVAKGKAKIPSLSTQQEAELGEIIERVKARPSQQKSLYILRRETPADDSAVYTRSGRVSVKPLAYWRNERCVYGGSPGGASLSDGARFPLNSIKEIIRTDEVDGSRSRSPSKTRRKGKKGKSQSRAGTVDDGIDSNSDSDANVASIDPDAEEWESKTGIFRGDVSIWDNDQQAPLEDQEEVELAYAPASIQTKEVKSMHPDGRTFKFAKLLKTNFFGSGLVELAPGDIKRPKNSRKMHMSFFVAKGRVTVEVGSLGGKMSRFSVGKGGYWQVPRGNQYSIENELDKSAKLFFSQACEPAPTMLEQQFGMCSS